MSRPYHAKSFGRFDMPPFQEIILLSGVFRCEMASGFYPWGKAHSRTAKCEAFHIAPRLFFMFLFFDSIHDSATMHNLSPEIFHWTKFMSKIFFIIEKNALFLHFLSVLLDFFFFLCIFVVSFQGQSTGKCANLMPH